MTDLFGLPTPRTCDTGGHNKTAPGGVCSTVTQGPRRRMERRLMVDIVRGGDA